MDRTNDYGRLLLVFALHKASATSLLTIMVLHEKDMLDVWGRFVDRLA